MNIFIAVSTFLFSLVASSPICPNNNCTARCPDGMTAGLDPYNVRCYKYVNDVQLGWGGANFYCGFNMTKELNLEDHWNGYSASIFSVFENSLIWDVILKNGGEPNTPVWTCGAGFSCLGPYGTNCGDPYWGWQDGRIFNYTNFDPSTSCSYLPDCGIAMVPSTGKWITTYGNVARPVICEFIWIG